MLQVCQQFPDTRILWAHSGALLPPEAVDRVLAQCGNVWGGLGARDPWRFVNNPLTAADGTLLPAWKALLLKYPARFMVGSDPVWPVDQMDRWDEAQLPKDVARQIGCTNAVVLFGRSQQVKCN
jgi:predicted TIM-barrel fold metal-dependent hydrolase